jgi:hypothetical protein
MRTMATLALILSLTDPAIADGPKPSQRPPGTHVIHSPSRDADTSADEDTQLAAAKRNLAKAKARKTATRAKAASTKATKALAKAAKRAERALAKARKAAALDECLDERGDSDEAAEICADEVE